MTSQPFAGALTDPVHFCGVCGGDHTATEHYEADWDEQESR